MIILFSKKRIMAVIIMIIIAIICVGYFTLNKSSKPVNKENTFVKWAEFNVPQNAMEKALKYDIDSFGKDIKINWIELLAYVGAKTGGSFKGYKGSQIDAIAKRLQKGETIDQITKDMKSYKYYYEIYNAVLGGLVGKYKIEVKDENNPKNKVWKEKYGIKAFSPIAKKYPYYHYNDFGASRSYGFKRKHLGNDLMGAVGTPIIAVEGGTVEALGWNQYGGWRIGIRSNDKKRYYYYAHLRKNFPYNKALTEGCTVKAGDVIGYLGRSGYSTNENMNNIDKPHLHFGMQLIFDESQKECNNEIWINVYNIVSLLDKYRSEVVKNVETKEFSRVYDIMDM